MIRIIQGEDFFKHYDIIYEKLYLVGVFNFISFVCKDLT